MVFLLANWRWLVPSALLIAMTIAWQLADRAAETNAAQRDYYKGELQRVIEDGQRRKDNADKAVEQGRVIIRDADKVAREIEAEPIQGQCETPAKVMEADL